MAITESVRSDSPGEPIDDEARVLDLCRRLLADAPPAETSPVEFLGRQFDLGLAWVHFPEGHGGLGLSPKLQKTVNETLARARAPRSRSAATCDRCSPTRRSGASSSPSRGPVPTWPGCRAGRCATATSGW